MKLLFGLNIKTLPEFMKRTKKKEKEKREEKNT